MCALLLFAATALGGLVARGVGDVVLEEVVEDDELAPLGACLSGVGVVRRCSRRQVFLMAASPSFAVGPKTHRSWLLQWRRRSLGRCAGGRGCGGRGGSVAHEPAREWRICFAPASPRLTRTQARVEAAPVDEDVLRRHRLRRFADARVDDAAPDAPAPAPRASSPPAPDADRDAMRKQQREQMQASVAPRQPPKTGPSDSAYVRSLARDEQRTLRQRGADAAPKDDRVTVKFPSPPPAKKAAAPAASAHETAALLTHFALQDVFGVVLTVEDQKRFANKALVPRLGAELAARGQRFLEAQDADAIIIERLEQLGPGAGICYVLECFARTQGAFPAAVPASLPAQLRASAVLQAMLFIEQCAAVSSGRDDVLLYLLQSPPVDAEHVLAQFVASLAARAVSEGGEQELTAVFAPCAQGTWQHVRRLDILGETSMPLRVLCVLLSNERVAHLVVSCDWWLPALATSGQTLELHSFLAPFFALSPLTQSVTLKVFTDQASMSESMQTTSRLVRTVQDRLVDACQPLLVAPSTRPALVGWLASVVALNGGVLKSMHDRAVLSSTGLLVNAYVVAARLFDQQWNAADADASLLQPLHWLKYMPEFGWSAADPLVPEVLGANTMAFRTQCREAVGLDDKPLHGALNDTFFVALALARVALVSLANDLRSFNRMLATLAETLRAMEVQGTAEARLQAVRLREQSKVVERALHCWWAVCYQPEMWELTVTLFGAASAMILRNAGDDDSAPVAMCVAALPQSVVETITEHFPRAMKHGLPFLGAGRSAAIVEMVLRFVGSSQRVHSPFLRGKLASVLAAMPAERLVDFRTAQRTLLPSLFQLWIDVNVMADRHNNFYEKMEIRGELLDVMEAMQSTTQFGVALQRHWTEHQASFLKMTYQLVTDINWVFDEVFSNLQSVASLELERQDAMTWGNQPPDVRTTREEQLEQAISRAGFYSKYLTSCLRLVNELSRHVPEVLLHADIGDALVAFLNYYLVQLAGTRYNDLNVRDPDRFGFKPHELLATLLHIYTRLARTNNAFATLVGKEERSFKEEQFRHVVKMAAQHTIVPSHELREFVALIDAALKAKQVAQQAEADEEDWPDDLLCAVNMTPLVAPVRLPSGKAVDRSTFKRLLLEGARDPFSRQPLDASHDVVDETLLAQVNEYRAQRMQQRK